MCGPQASSSNLKVCEDCGRRFNPASFEKHRAVCRSVFGKSNRTPFESSSQRLRALPQPAQPNSRRQRGVSSPPGEGNSPRAPRRNSKTGTMNAVVAPDDLSLAPPASPPPPPAPPPPPVPPATNLGQSSNASGANGGGTRSGQSVPRKLTSPMRPLETCPHCERSFRAAALEKHVKVCQKAFEMRRRNTVTECRRRMKGSAPDTQAGGGSVPNPPNHGERYNCRVSFDRDTEKQKCRSYIPFCLLRLRTILIKSILAKRRFVASPLGSCAEGPGVAHSVGVAHVSSHVGFEYVVLRVFMRAFLFSLTLGGCR